MYGPGKNQGCMLVLVVTVWISAWLLVGSVVWLLVNHGCRLAIEVLSPGAGWFRLYGYG
jgi:hypothetical protein